VNKGPTSAAAQEELEGRAAPQLTGRDVFKVLFRRKWIVLVLFLSTSVFVGWNASRIPTELRATAKVLLNRGMRNSALDRNVSLLTWDETVNSELEIAQSQPVIDRAQRILNEEAIEEGIEAVEIDPSHAQSKLLNESNVIGLEYMSLDYTEVRPVANALARGYIEIHDELFALPNVQKYFEDHVSAAESRLEDLTEQRREVQEDEGAVRLGTQQDYVVRALGERREELVDVERRLTVQTTELEEIRHLFYDEDVSIPFDTRLHEDQIGMLHVLYKLRGTVLDLEEERSELLTRYTEQHPAVVALDERISNAQADMREEAEQLIRVKESNVAMTRAEANTLRSEIDDLEEELLRFPQAEQELDNLDRSIDLTAKTYQRLLENQIQIGISTISSRGYTLSLLSEAGPPVATNPRDPIRLALVPAFSLLVGISIAFFIETMDHSLKSREDVERHVELPVLASIPWRRGMKKA